MYIMLFLTAGTVLERFVPCTLSTFRGRCSAAIQYQVSITGSYSETAVRTNADLLKKSSATSNYCIKTGKMGKSPSRNTGKCSGKIRENGCGIQTGGFFC